MTAEQVKAQEAGGEDPLARVEKSTEAEQYPVKHPVDIIIDKRICMQCYNCVRACTVFDSVYEIGEDGYPYAARKEDCIMCLICHTVCPPRAITHVGVRRTTMVILDRDIAERMTRIR